MSSRKIGKGLRCASRLLVYICEMVLAFVGQRAITIGGVNKLKAKKLRIHELALTSDSQWRGVNEVKRRRFAFTKRMRDVRANIHGLPQIAK